MLRCKSVSGRRFVFITSHFIRVIIASKHLCGAAVGKVVKICADTFLLINYTHELCTHGDGQFRTNGNIYDHVANRSLWFYRLPFPLSESEIASMPFRIVSVETKYKS